MSEWNVALAISGPIDLENRTHRICPLKGDSTPFRTNVTLRRDKNGVILTVGVRASSQQSARDAGLYYVGRAIDVLCLETDLPLHVSHPGTLFRSSIDQVRQIVNEQSWMSCFETGREYGASRSTFSRALSWYRKAHISENPIDKFIAFWASIEIVGSKYANKNERTRKGSVNQVCDCFCQLWGGCESWKVIPNDAEWVSKFCDRRNQIAHGTVPLVEMEAIREISDTIPRLHSLARDFLRDWQRSERTLEFTS